LHTTQWMNNGWMNEWVRDEEDGRQSMKM
jgi:hypothetical protein